MFEKKVKPPTIKQLKIVIKLIKEGTIKCDNFSLEIGTKEMIKDALYYSFNKNTIESEVIQPTENSILYVHLEIYKENGITKIKSFIDDLEY